MKQRNFFVTISMAILIAAGCSPEDVKQYVANDARKASAFAGTWTGSKAVMKDNDATRKNFPNQSMDITSAASFNQLKITLNATDNQPGTFTVNAGTAPNILGLSSGTWKVDNTDKVSQIQLINGTDTVRLGVYVLSDLAGNKLSLTRVKSLDGTPMITYNYDFTR